VLSPVDVTAAENDFEVVDELHTYLDMAGHWTYGLNASSELGIGINSGGHGWKISGAAKIYRSNSGKVTADRGPHYGKKLKTAFRYVKERNDVICGSSPSNYYHESDTIRAVGWVPGSMEGSDTSGYDGTTEYYKSNPLYRGSFVHDSHFQTENAEGYTYTAETGAFGVQLNAKTDFSHEVKIVWDFGSEPYDHDLFGHDGDPLRASIVYAY
jgi:hypothetical protein